MFKKNKGSLGRFVSFYPAFIHLSQRFCKQDMHKGRFLYYFSVYEILSKNAVPYGAKGFRRAAPAITKAIM